jgi:cytochrome c biogenesis protein CcmG, thiol:disulfide interchange protein DsbE
MIDQVDPPEVAPRQGGRHLARTVAIVVGVVVVALVALLATRKSTDDQVARSQIVGKAVPSVKGTTLTGTHFDVDDHLGQWVVVDFFGSWCGPCQAEQPELVKFAKAHASDPNVAMVGVMYTDKKTDALNFYKKSGAHWPILDDDGSTALSFGVTGVPETYVVDPQGQVVAKYEAGITAADLDQVIQRYGGESGLSGASSGASTTTTGSTP